MLPPTHLYLKAIGAIGLVALPLAVASCDTATEPPHAQSIVLEGGPYERGYQHGSRLEAHVKGLYTRLLTAALLPFLNREQVNIAPVLPIYDQQKFADGEFSYQMLLESGRHLYDHYMDEEHQLELQGLADGADMPLDDIIVLNTFVDTMMAFRAVVVFIEDIQTPFIQSVGWDGDLQNDGIDNDGDGTADQEGEGWIEAYDRSPYAHALEVPADASFRMVLVDRALGGLHCVDPRNADPLEDLRLDAGCVDPICVRPECSGESMLGRDCLSETALECLEPRINGDCLDPMCLQSHDPACVNPDSIRIQMNETQFVASDDAIQTRRLPLGPPGMTEPTYDPNNPHYVDCQGPLEVTFTPPNGFPEGEAVYLVIQAGDMSPVYSPGPYHERFMRDERIAFTTEGYAAQHGEGEALHEVPNKGVDDGRSQPPSIAFAVRGEATTDGQPRLGHHFALLDSDILHEHAVLFTQIPDEGIPHSYLSWSGIIWGLAGMNLEGLTYAVNTSDTLDNPLAGHILNDIFKPENLVRLLESLDLKGLAAALAETRLLAVGEPLGLVGRNILSKTDNVDDAAAYIESRSATYGWNVMLADADGEMAALELDAGVLEIEDETTEFGDRDGYFRFDPDLSNPANVDPYGRRWSSVGPDDLFMASHFRKNVEDIQPNPIMGSFSPSRQRGWTGFYFRSLRAYYTLAGEIQRAYGEIDTQRAIEILRSPDLVDTRDSMLSAVFEPAEGKIWWAMGEVPATDGEFLLYDFRSEMSERGIR